MKKLLKKLLKGKTKPIDTSKMPINEKIEKARALIGKPVMFESGVRMCTSIEVTSYVWREDLNNADDILKRDGYLIAICGTNSCKNIFENVRLATDAEILEDPSTVNVRGYSPVLNGDVIEYGCAKILVKDILIAGEFLEKVSQYGAKRNASSATRSPVVQFGNGEFNLLTIRALIHKFNLK